MRFRSVAIFAGMLCHGCSTLDQSLRMGAIAGSLAGAGATYAGAQSAGANPSLENVGIGASIGMAVGLISSYFIHESIVQDREDADQQTQIFFGDLPPSPFVIPNSKKKGAR